MNQECNNLIEQYNVVKRTGRMIYGEDLMERAQKKQDLPEDNRNSSDELIAEFRPKGCKSCFNRSYYLLQHCRQCYNRKRQRQLSVETKASKSATWQALSRTKRSLVSLRQSTELHAVLYFVISTHKASISKIQRATSLTELFTCLYSRQAATQSIACKRSAKLFNAEGFHYHEKAPVDPKSSLRSWSNSKPTS